MAKGFKTGGRVKGSLNKTTRDVVERLAELDCDPIEGMARIAADPKTSVETRGRMYMELAQYVHPKRKAIEVTDEGVSSGPQTIRVQFVDPPAPQTTSLRPHEADNLTEVGDERNRFTRE